MIEALKAVLAALFAALLGRFFPKPDPEKEMLHAIIEAKNEEVEVMSAPARPKLSIVRELRDTQQD